LIERMTKVELSTEEQWKWIDQLKEQSNGR
jgi:hypothetical protein